MKITSKKLVIPDMDSQKGTYSSILGKPGEVVLERSLTGWVWKDLWKPCTEFLKDFGMVVGTVLERVVG